MDPEDIQEQTKEEEAGKEKKGSEPGTSREVKIAKPHVDLTSSNDDTSHPSISEPQPTVSSQDVSIPAPKSTLGALATPMGNVKFGSAHAAVKIHQHPEPAHVNVQPLAENLQSQLVDRSKQVIGESNMPIQLDRNIEPVRLEVLDTRNNCSVTIDQLFDKTLEKAQRYTEDQSAEYAKRYIEKHANTVWVVGPPGVGKTTLLKMMVKQILKHEFLPDTEYIFFIKVKDIDFNKEVTLLEFLTTNSRVKVNYTEEESKALITFLHNNPNVAIFFDGLDEASTKEFAMTSHVYKLDGKYKPVDIMQNLFNLTLLPKAKIVVTSTPDQMFNLQHCYRPTSLFEVLGLLEEAKNNLGTQLCGEKYPAIKKILDQQPNLAHLCYFPINFILIVSCLLSNEGSDIKTMTQVLIFSMTRFVESSHLKGEVPLDKVGAEMVKLAHLAYNGIKKRKLVFEKSDFDAVELADEMVTNFFHTYVDKSSGLRMKILEGNKRSYFTHLTWQEFYAAVYLMLFVSYPEFQQLQSVFEDSRWDVVLRFMFGICNYYSYKQLKLIFPAKMFQDYEEKKNFLTSMLCKTKSPSGKIHGDIPKRFGWLHEYNDAETSRAFETNFPMEIEMWSPKQLMVAGDMVYAFKSFTEPHKLALDLYRTPDVCETLLRGIHGTSSTISTLTVSGIQFTDSLMESLILHLNFIQQLNFVGLTNSSLSPYMEILSNAIYQRTDKIKLEMWYQRLNDDDVKYLAGCLGNISLLKMHRSDISSEGYRILKEAIQQLQSIQEFELEGDGSNEFKLLVNWFLEFKSSTNPLLTTEVAIPHVQFADSYTSDQNQRMAPNKRRCNSL